MGKRQKRIFQHQILSQKEALLGCEACVITTDGRTVRGIISSVGSQEISVKDMRQITQKHLLAEVVEIVLDFEAEY